MKEYFIKYIQHHRGLGDKQCTRFISTRGSVEHEWRSICQLSDYKLTLTDVVRL